MQSEVPESAMGSTEGAIAPSAPVWLQAWSPVILKRVSMFLSMFHVQTLPVIQESEQEPSTTGAAPAPKMDIIVAKNNGILTTK